MSENRRSVTVIGLGPMGRATVKSLLEAGVDVTVWNRTVSKAEEMAELGANRARSVTEAVTANEVVLLSLTDYDVMYTVLGDGPADLSGKVVVNLSSDSPEKTRWGAQWVLERGGQYITGAYMTQSDDLKHKASALYLSGPKALVEEHRDLLGLLCPIDYMGVDYGMAQVYYQAQLAMFHAFAIGVEQSLAIIENTGESIDSLVPYLSKFAQGLGDFVVFFATGAKAGGMMGDAISLMMHAGAQHVIDTSQDVGVDASLTSAIQGIYRRAIDASEESGKSVSTYEILRGDHSG